MNPIVDLTGDPTTSGQDYSEMQVVVSRRRSSVESLEKIQIVRQMQMKSLKVNADLKLANTPSRKGKRQSKSSSSRLPEALKPKESRKIYVKDKTKVRVKCQKSKGADVVNQKLQGSKSASNKETPVSTHLGTNAKIVKVGPPVDTQKRRKRKLSKQEDPNVVGYVPRSSHRHEHQRQRARQYENYICGAPLRAGLDSDSD